MNLQDPLTHALKYMTPKEFCGLAQTCKSWKKIIKNCWSNEILDTKSNREIVALPYVNTSLENMNFKENFKTTMKVEVLNRTGNISIERENKIDGIINDLGTRYIQIMLQSTIETFTLKELRHLISLYVTPEGKSILNKLNNVTSFCTPLMLKEAELAVAKMQD
jgi:hypothetical protein